VEVKSEELAGIKLGFYLKGAQATGLLNITHSTSTKHTSKT
jgi:hypothetical protein